MGIFDRFKKKNEPPRRSIVGEAWEFYSYVFGEEQRASIAFDVKAAQEEAHTGHPHCRRAILFVPEEHVGAEGLPDREELGRLGQLEKGLVEVLDAAGVDCRQVGRMTYNGLRELVFQVTDTAAFAEQAAAWKKQVKGYEVELVEGEGWKFFDEKIRPTPQQWRWIGDRRTRDQLLNAGSDPHKPHTFEHTFLGAPEDLAEVAEFLEGEGFLRARLGEGHLVMSRLSTLSADDINEVTEYLREVAEDHGVDYDGWGAAVVR